MDSKGSLAVHRTIVAVDVEGFGDQRRTNRNQLAVREGLYRTMCEAFRDAEIPWVERDHEDRGDGMFILVGSEVPKSLFVESLPSAIVSALRRHNGTHSDLERIRLRMALHAGEVNYDKHGATAASINLTFRLLESGPVKEALASSPGVLAVITSSWFFEEVVRHSAANAAAYHPISVTVKETATTGWVYLPDYAEWAGTQTVTTLPGIGRHDTPRDQAGLTASPKPISWPGTGGMSSSITECLNHQISSTAAGFLSPTCTCRPLSSRSSAAHLQLPPREVTLEQFSEEIGRTVLLGDPGSGKTTAAQVLMHYQAAKRKRPGAIHGDTARVRNR